MERRTRIIFFIISTIISLVIIFASYYGIFRYARCRLSSCDSYVAKYRNEPKIKSNSRVVAAVPNRGKNIVPVVNSVLDQTMKVDEIDVSGDPPSELRGVVASLKCLKNYQNNTHIIPVIMKETSAGTKILCLRDDKIYGKDFVETMVVESDKNPDSIIRNRDGGEILIKPEFFTVDVLGHDVQKFDDNWVNSHYDKEKCIDYEENYSF